MKRLIALLLITLPLAVLGQDLPKSEFSFSAGYLFEGEVYVAYPNVYGSVGETFHMRADYVGFFGDNFGMGGFVSYSNPYYWGTTVSAAEFGFVAKARFKAGENLVVKFPLYVGYRSYGNNAGQGLGIDFSGQLSFPMEKVRPFVEVGFITQPIGGTDFSDMTYGPVFLVALGISL